MKIHSPSNCVLPAWLPGEAGFLLGFWKLGIADLPKEFIGDRMPRLVLGIDVK
jgi:hypothetical protein